MSFPTVAIPVLSPSLNEYDQPTFVDDQGNTLPILGVVTPTSSGVTGLETSVVKPTPDSQVTGKRQPPLVGTPAIPTVALVGINPSTGAIEAFAPASAQSVSGKF